MVARPDKQKYKVWEDGYFAENIFSPEFLTQKLDYIHNNPLQDHWRLAETPEDYPWSSARFYVRGEPALVACEGCAGTDDVDGLLRHGTGLWSRADFAGGAAHSPRFQRDRSPVLAWHVIGTVVPCRLRGWCSALTKVSKGPQSRLGLESSGCGPMPTSWGAAHSPRFQRDRSPVFGPAPSGRGSMPTSAGAAHSPKFQRGIRSPVLARRHRARGSYADFAGGSALTKVSKGPQSRLGPAPSGCGSMPTSVGAAHSPRFQRRPQVPVAPGAIGLRFHADLAGGSARTKVSKGPQSRLGRQSCPPKDHPMTYSLTLAKALTLLEEGLGLGESK